MVDLSKLPLGGVKKISTAFEYIFSLSVYMLFPLKHGRAEFKDFLKIQPLPSEETNGVFLYKQPGSQHPNPKRRTQNRNNHV